ncbi:VOC family protein [Fusibacter paucivorans]|uniref:VOC family protein n=1 Tax=Fusibacter paucivorans TaxID=76009 RepID=A0ABS5PQJ3_9FIRM|nr:VOC family protein [Fusibacter paucivorans]MBS7526307.1 VOC family protein [Fusibacter paucivorans]
MGYAWTTITVKDLEKSLAFYTEIAGLTLERRFSPTDGVTIAFLTDGESKTELELMCHHGEEAIEHMPFISIGFTCDSLADTMARLRERGDAFDETVYSPMPALKFIFANDPDGLRVQLIEQQS